MIGRAQWVMRGMAAPSQRRVIEKGLACGELHQQIAGLKDVEEVLAQVKGRHTTVPDSAQQLGGNRDCGSVLVRRGRRDGRREVPSPLAAQNSTRRGARGAAGQTRPESRGRSKRDRKNSSLRSQKVKDVRRACAGKVPQPHELCPERWNSRYIILRYRQAVEAPSRRQLRSEHSRQLFVTAQFGRAS